MKTTYTKEQFLADVAKEAKALKKNATKQEISKLDILQLEPTLKTNCIYGQMTGNCLSNRASVLIGKSCPRYFINPEDYDLYTFAMIKKYVNGKKLSVSKLDDYLDHYSAIEVYIQTPKAKNENLIDFLQGKRKDLVL